MPVTPTYPGVYIEELPSGVRTITGVSTSVTAFLGKAKRGPVNRAVRVLGFADFERRFGGLSSNSEMSYAVSQFFLNGGGEAWIVRIAKDALPATLSLENGAGAEVLDLEAIEQGSAGNGITAAISHAAGNPASNFNLTLVFTSPDNPADSRVEVFDDLSMNPGNPRFVETLVNGASKLVTVERTAAGAAPDAGTSRSGELEQDVDALVDSSHRSFRVVVDGGDPQTVNLDPAADTAGGDTDGKLDTLCDAIDDALTGADCARDGSRIVITSATTGESSSVRVLPGLSNDASVRLELGTLNGGVETDGAAALRPVEMPDPGRLTSGLIVGGDLDGVDATHHRLQISLDGLPPQTVSVGAAGVAAGVIADRLAEIAGRVEGAVRDAKKGHPAFDGFTCTVHPSEDRLVLASGTRGDGSSVFVATADSDDAAATLELLAVDGATAAAGADVPFTGGNESDFSDGEAYGLFIGSRADREGLFALESVDLFNLLCMPGVTDAGILADAVAYCQERRAFLVVDAPAKAKTPAEMEQVALGTALPKSDHAAVYWPWVEIADRLKGGQLRTSAPCGTVAGLFARTDATRGVWKAPAGTEANLAGVQALEYKTSDRENGVLNPRGVNVLRNFPVIGNVAWGARTLRGANELASEWKYVPVRRLALMIEESLFRGTQWVVFEPNDEPLWAQIRLNVGSFMQGLFRQGAFQGATPREAYLVKCDRETTTQDDVDRGVVNILVGFAPLKPAEFVIIQIQQLAGQNRS